MIAGLDNIFLFDATFDELKDRIKKLEEELAKAKPFVSDWKKVDSKTSQEFIVNHNLKAIPTNFTIQFTPNLPSNDNTLKVYDMTWCQNYCNNDPNNSAYHSGSVCLTDTQIKIPIWGGGYIGRYWDSKTWHTWKEGYIRVIVKL